MNYKVSFVWWAGWVVLYPLRLLFTLFVAVGLAASPSGFYAFLNMQEEKDQSKWRF